MIEQTGKKKKKITFDKVSLILTYNPGLPDIWTSVKRHWPLLQSSERCKDIFKKPPIRAFRRSKNLRDILVKARINKPNTGQILTPQCTNLRCNLCKQLKDTNTRVTNHKTGNNVTTRTDITCRTPNVVYILSCPTCHKQYVGETKREFKVRYAEHLADITHHRQKHVAVHFNLPNHGNTGAPVAKILSVIKGNPETKLDIRKNTESKWIHNLRKIAPWGINRKK